MSGHTSTTKDYTPGATDHPKGYKPTPPVETPKTYKTTPETPKGYKTTPPDTTDDCKPKPPTDYTPDHPRVYKGVSPKTYKPETPKDYTPDYPKTYKPDPPKTYKPDPPKDYTPDDPKTYKPEPPKDYTPEPPKSYTPEPPKTYKPVPPTGYPPTVQKPPSSYKPVSPTDYTPTPPTDYTPEPPTDYTPKPPTYKPEPPTTYTPIPPPTDYTPIPPKGYNPVPPTGYTPPPTTGYTPEPPTDYTPPTDYAPPMDYAPPANCAPTPCCGVIPAGLVTDPLRDGNIDPEIFTVASDIANSRCRVAYKTQIDDVISMAEIEYSNCEWGLPCAIKVDPKAVPGEDFALAYDPNNSDERSLFFAREDGDGYIYMQSYESCNSCWGPPCKLKGQRGRDEVAKAHRFSKFAATHYICPNTKGMMLVYYVDESNGLQELMGRLHVDGPVKEYRWTRTGLLDECVTPDGHLAVVQEGSRTRVLFRNAERELWMATGIRDSKGRPIWDLERVLGAFELAKNSPLAIASRVNGNLTTFYLQRDGKTQTIYCVDLPRCAKPVRVGKLEPSSNLCCASFPNTSTYDCRLLSVSKLDGDNILLERIERKPLVLGEKQEWVISGGIVSTDVDHLY